MKASPTRPTKAIIDLEAIAANVDQLAAHLPENTQKFAVVKANAYGHGAVPVAKKLAPIVDAFCVSNMDEALELREAGLDLPILILGVVPKEVLPLAIEYQITLTVASLAWLEQVLVSFSDLTGLKIHLKIDSGMGRIGFRESQEVQQAVSLLSQAGAEVEGIFTHFATADEADDSKYQSQLARFEAVLADLETVPSLVHISNSAASLWHSDSVQKAVRLGDIIYGLNPSGRDLELPYPVQSALSLVTEIVHIKILTAGQTVGYGATYAASQEEIIATLPVGYADGWTRDMQGFEVLVDGQHCPIVGRVSMDQTTIRLPKIYPLGTLVTLIGRNGTEEISATDVAIYRGTINYEVVCLLSDRVARFYKGAD